MPVIVTLVLHYAAQPNLVVKPPLRNPSLTRVGSIGNFIMEMGWIRISERRIQVLLLDYNNNRPGRNPIGFPITTPPAAASDDLLRTTKGTIPSGEGK